MIPPGEFLRVHRDVPWKLRTREWWDTFSFMVGVFIAIVSPLLITILFPGEIFDVVALILVIAVSFVFITWGDLLDPLIMPLQPPFRKLPGRLLVVIGLVLPFVTAFLINTFSGIGSYTLIIINAIIGTCITALFLKIPRSVHGSSRAIHSGVIPAMIAIVFCATCIARVHASGAMIASPCICPESILTAGVIVSALSAGLNAPSVFQRFSKGGQPPGSVSVVTGKAAMDLLAINGLARFDKAKKGYILSPALAGWLNRPAADPLQVDGNKVAGDARDRRSGETTGQAGVTEITGGSVGLNADGTIRQKSSSIIVTGNGPHGFQSPAAISSDRVAAVAGAQMSAGINPSGGMDLKATQTVIDVTGESVKTTIDHAGRTYAAEGGAVPGTGITGSGSGISGQGSTRAGPPFCRFCGSPVIAGAVFCNKCGKEVQVEIGGHAGTKEASGAPEPPGNMPRLVKTEGKQSPATGPGKIPADHRSAEGASPTSPGTAEGHGAGPGPQPGPGLSPSSTTQGTGPATGAPPSPPVSSGAAAGLVGGPPVDGLRSPGSADLRTTQAAVDVVGESIKTTVDQAGRTYGAEAPVPVTGAAVPGGAEPGTLKAGDVVRPGPAGSTENIGSGASPAAGQSAQKGKPSFCRDCGARIEPDMKFCNQCGKPVRVPVSGSATSACPECGATLSLGSKFCKKCGKPVTAAPAARTCPQCGRDLLPGSVFCRECGKKIG